MLTSLFIDSFLGANANEALANFWKYNISIKALPYACLYEKYSSQGHVLRRGGALIYTYVRTYIATIMWIFISPVDDESDDELSTGVAVVVSIVVTFIITLVVTALITLIITSLYYKHHYIKKSLVRQEGDSHILTEDIKSNDSAYATTKANIVMDTNPAYGTATTIKMDTNPAYATTAH